MYYTVIIIWYIEVWFVCDVSSLLQWLANQSISQIAHNIIKFWITFSPLEKVLLKLESCILYIFGDSTFGYHKKVEALRGKQKFVHTLLK